MKQSIFFIPVWSPVVSYFGNKAGNPDRQLPLVEQNEVMLNSENVSMVNPVFFKPFLKEIVYNGDNLNFCYES